MAKQRQVSRRRYTPIGTHPTYDATYGSLKVHSPILNQTGTARSEDTLKMGNKPGMELLLLVREGSKDGKYYDPTFGGDFVDAKITTAEKNLKALDAAFQRYKDDRRNSGYAVPTEMPSDLFERKLELEATLDILLEECDTLRSRLQEYGTAKFTQDDENVLKYGPRGNGGMDGGIIVVLDGQNISINTNGELYIDDERSPYNGMMVCDYREKIVQPWQKKQSDKINEAKGGFVFGPRTVSKESLPPWPEDLPKPEKEAIQQPSSEMELADCFIEDD